MDVKGEEKNKKEGRLKMRRRTRRRRTRRRLTVAVAEPPAVPSAAGLSLGSCCLY